MIDLPRGEALSINYSIRHCDPRSILRDQGDRNAELEIRMWTGKSLSRIC